VNLIAGDTSNSRDNPNKFYLKLNILKFTDLFKNEVATNWSTHTCKNLPINKNNKKTSNSRIVTRTGLPKPNLISYNIPPLYTKKCFKYQEVKIMYDIPLEI